VRRYAARAAGTRADGISRGARNVNPMANFPPEDGSTEPHELRDAEARPASGVDQSDLELVRRVQRGERGAFDLLVLRYQHKVVKLVARLLRDPAEAEDVAQEAFVKAYRAMGSFRGDSAFYTWLYRIAVNTARNTMASRQRRPLAYEAELNESEQSVVESRMRHTDTPEAAVLSDEIHGTVNRAVEALPEDLRTAIILREVEGLSYEEIAEAMDCPVGTVRSRIFRAREAIDRSLKPLLD
jgi:RNA polymerase sigma-70 factor (ECF subfamily)